MKNLVLIAHNIRSAHNVGSLLRTSEGLGVDKVYFTGYTPYPHMPQDSRLPHIAAKVTRQIDKTALSADKFIDWQHQDDIFALLDCLRIKDYKIIALEQTPDATKLADFEPAKKIAVIVGREVEGIEPEILNYVDAKIEIEMAGKKESFNVAVAAAIALYTLKH